MANEDFSNNDDIKKIKEMFDNIIGGKLGPFMNFFNDPEILKKLQEEGKVDLSFSITADENGSVNINSFSSNVIGPNQFEQTAIESETFFDLIEDENKIIIIGDVPVYNRNQIHLSSKNNNKIIIKGKSEIKSFTKEFDLPEFDEKSVKAKLRNGSLEISMTIKEKKSNESIRIE
jgi:HSP20 family molecular chaperone IbpA